MTNKQGIVRGAAILTAAGILSRIIGFFYRIFLSKTIGAEGMGLYQLVFPLYALCFALTASGVQTAISRFVAARTAEGDERSARQIFQAGLSLSVILSVLCALALHHCALPVSKYILKEPRCADLLRLLSWSVPFSTVHSCVNGYYYGKKQTGIPSFLQLLEQTARVVSSWLFFTILTAQHRPVTPLIAIYGILISEFLSMILSLIFITCPKKSTKKTRSHPARCLRHPCSFLENLRVLLTLSIPLTANHVLLHLLHGTETILIPARLRLAGMSVSGALSLYGILTGMALPLILFPSAITGSVSVMLLPTVAEAQANGNTSAIELTSTYTVKYCLLLGILAAGVFFLLGPSLGQSLFGNKTAGMFIRSMALICPFLYLTATLSSILNGLGKTTLCFLQNTSGLVLRILFVIFAIPKLGIMGYLWGLLLSEAMITLCAICFLRRYVTLQFSCRDEVVIPVICLAGAAVIVFAFADVLPPMAGIWLLCIKALGIGGLYLWFLYLLGIVSVRPRQG